MDAVLAKDVILQVKIGEAYISKGCAETCAFTLSNELIGKTDVNAGLFRKRRVRISDSGMSVQGLTTLVDDEKLSTFYFLQETVRRSELDLRILFTDEGNIQKQIQGIYVIESIGVNGGRIGDWSDFNIEFKGTGTISLADPEDDGSSIPGDLQWDWWETTPGASSITGPGFYGRSFAGEQLIMVDREGLQYDEVVSGQTGRQYSSDGTTISFDANLTFNDNERVFVLWREV